MLSFAECLVARGDSLGYSLLWSCCTAVITWNKRLWISLPEIEIDKYTQSEKYRKIGEYIDECKDDRRIFVAK